MSMHSWKTVYFLAETEITVDYIQKNLDKLVSWAVEKAGGILLALVFLFLGFKLVKLVLKGIRKFFDKHDMDASVESFLCSFIQIVLYVLVVITAATIVGFEVTSFITILGSASIAVGLALQGSLSNLAGGVLILILKPFSVGDYIIEKDTGQEGTVTAIDIFYTRLTTPDNKMIVVPNGNLSATSIVNVSANPIRRVDLKIGVAYDADLELTKQTLHDAIVAEALVLQDRPIDIFIDGFDDSAVTMGMFFWVSTDDYMTAKWNVQMNVKTYLDRAGIEIPYRKVDINLYQSKDEQ